MSINESEKTLLTCGEINSLWSTYQYESLSICGMHYFLQHINDNEIKDLIEKGFALAEKRVQKVKDILTKEEHTIPEGFTIDRDVNAHASRLFSDELYLEYLLHTLQMEFFAYNQSMLTAVKKPVQKFFAEIMQDTIKLEMETKEVTKEKGLFIRSPHVPPIKTISYVKVDDAFLSGWNSKRRPLLASEMSELVFNAKRNALGQAVITAFSQVAKTKEVREFFVKGRGISGKHVRVFSEKLTEEYLSSSALLQTDHVSDSTESPFSEKLMMNFITSLITSSIGSYGFSMAMSPRHDLGVMYTRLISEIAAYSNEGAKIMIRYSWMEQPPMATNRDHLVQTDK